MIALLVIPMIMAGLWTGFCQAAEFEWMGPMQWAGFVFIGGFWGFMATIKALFD